MDFTGVIRNSFDNVLLCGEYAGSLLGITNFPDTHIIAQSAFIDKEIDTDYFTVSPVKNLDLSYVEEVRKGVWITNPARTICDMIRYDSEYSFIQEALDYYIFYNENEKEHYNEVLNVARYYNIEQKVLDVISFAKSHDYCEEN
ncbi:hypothetical protein IR152_04425 [Clostridioides sp. ES-S-0108-01]|uniref:hypothetical protein n=1 Tax=Clostridioides sp. ES-S-0108-01 TaxID=2770773 RepID=UPI001D0C3EB6|nr:hypothetical protein [Clostridioides sp. ES-S-0108-01]UDN52734.1 hypothetical protein JJC16_09005 [Clostridioides sp. ES-S-0107-01]